MLPFLSFGQVTNSGDVSYSGQSYLSLTGQVITGAQVNLTSHVTGILPIANGGTGVATGGWNISGNSITAGSDFLGSTNNVSLRFRTNNTARAVLDSNGRFGVGLASPVGVIDIAWGGIGTNPGLFFGGDLGAATRTNNTAKYGNAASPPYTNSQQPVSVINTYSDNTQNVITIGGGSATQQAATSTLFRTASAINTATGTVRMNISSSGRIAIGTNTPTALMHFDAGTASASGAPLKFTSGTNLTVIENGAIEYDGTDYFASVGGTRQTISKGKSGSFSGVGTATTAFTVTFGGTQPNATYKTLVTPTAALSAALFYITNKTTTTFDVMYLAGLTGTVTFDWQIIN